MTDRDERLLQAFLDDLGAVSAPSGFARRVSRRIQDEHPARASRFAAWSMPVAAAVVIVGAVGVGLIVAGPKPSPSVSPVVPASASASPSAPSSASQTPLSSPSVTPVPSATPSPSALGGVFHVTLDPGGFALPVLVDDGSLSVTAAAAGPPNLGTVDPVGVAQGPGQNRIVVSWVGGGCDQLTQMALDATRTTITVGTLTSGPCDAVGIERAVELTFAEPVPAASIRGRLGTAPNVTTGMLPKAVWFANGNHGLVAGWDKATGVSILAETSDAGQSWTTTPIGWGVTTGVGAVVGQDIAEVPVVALQCADAGNGGTTEAGCLAGVYRLEGSHWVRSSSVSPLVLATQGNEIVVEAPGTLPSTGDTAAFPPRDFWLSRDGGAAWTKVANPCDLINMGAAGTTFGTNHRIEVLCEGEGAGGTAKKQLQRAIDDPPTAWTTEPPPPDQGTGMQLDLSDGGHGVAWGDRSPLLTTSDGGASWTPHPDVADGEARFVEDASAYGGGWAVIVGDPARQAALLLLSEDGSSWREVAAYPG